MDIRLLVVYVTRLRAPPLLHPVVGGLPLCKPPPCISKLGLRVRQLVLRVAEFLDARLLLRDERTQPSNLLAPLGGHCLSVADRCFCWGDLRCLTLGLTLFLPQPR